MSPVHALALAALSLVVAWVGPSGSVPALAPDLPLLAVLLIALHRPEVEAAAVAAGLGLLQDAAASAPFGSRGMVLAGAAVVMFWLRARVDPGALPGRLVLLALGSAAAEAIAALVAHLVQPPAPSLSPLAVLGHALATAVLGSLLWPSARPRPAAA